MQKINEYIPNTCRSTTDGHNHFDPKRLNSKTTGEELCVVLDHLMSTKDVLEQQKGSKYSQSYKDAAQYLLSREGTLLNKLIKDYIHDHNSRTWSSVVFEHLHASDLAALAAKMYPDGKVQLEMDFI